MTFSIQEAGSLALLIASVIAVIKSRKIDKAFYPFVFCVWIGTLNEVISFTLIYYFKTSNIINANIYYLIEGLLLTWLFKNLRVFERTIIFYFLACFLVAVWTVNIFIISDMKHIASYFVIAYSLLVVLLSITCINKLLVTKRRVLLTDAVFLLCVGFTIYYTVSTLVEIFWLYGLNSSKYFRGNIYLIIDYVNLFTNLLYALAILWMPRRQEFTLPS